MNLTGYTVRYLSDSQSGSFIFNNLQTTAVEVISGTTPSGQEFRIGFSGITGAQAWFFSFKNGKIYDPEGRWFASYDQTSLTTLSGDFTSTDYDYYYNGEIICATGKKPSYDINCWFATGISGASAVADIFVNSGPIQTFLDMQQGFFLGKNWSGSFYHNNLGPVSILSGTLFMPDASEFIITGTGLSYCSGANVVPFSGYRTIYLAHTGSQERTGLYTVGVTVYTDFGQANFTITGSGLPSKAGFVGNSLSPSTGWNITYPGASGTGIFNYYFSTSVSDISGNSLYKPFGVVFSYASGYTGVFTHVSSSIAIGASGGTYTIPPTIYITPTGGGFPLASGTGLLNGGQVTGVSWITSGIYTGNTGLYSLTGVGGNGTGFSGNIIWGTSYLKTFTGNFVLNTGAINQSLTSGGLTISQTLYSGQNWLPPNVNVVDFLLTFSGVDDISPLFYSLIASGFYDTSTDINLYTGLGYAIHS